MTVAFKNKKPIVVTLTTLRQAGFKNGQELEIKASGGVITILPKAPITGGEYTPAERRAIDRGIAASEKQYAAGKSYGPFETAAEANASIDANLRKRADAKKRKLSDQ